MLEAPEPADLPELDEDAIDDLFDEVADIVEWELSGNKTDWELHPYEVRRLVHLWHETLREVAEIRTDRMQTFLKGWLKAE